MPSSIQEGSSIVMADDSDHRDMIQKGFTKIGKYEGDKDEGHSVGRSYYTSTVSARNAFRQGVAQAVHSTYQGVDARTGISKTGDMAGTVTGAQAKSVTRRKLAELQSGRKVDGLKPGDHLLPVFDKDGAIVAYDRPMPKDKLAVLNRDTHLGRMLGVWSGRILEETLADEYNKSLVQALKQIHESETGLKAVKNRSDEYENMADPKHPDPVVRDAWNTLGWQIKQDAAEIFGKPGYLPVRRDMMNDALGYRAAGVTDAFTGITRFSPKTQEQIQKTMTFILGNDAFKRLSQGEKLVQNGVSYAKTTIIVRGLVVGVQNILSNTQHLMMSGMGPIEIAVAMRNKFVEITEYTKNKDTVSKLNADLAAVFDNPAKANKIKAQIIALEDANNRLSIKPLIDAGEFSTVSEDLTEADRAMRNGGIASYLDNAVEKLPGYGKTVAKNLLITKDTALFQGLNRMVQYGDLVAMANEAQTRKKG